MFQPRINQHTCHRQARWYLWQMITTEPPSRCQLRTLQSNLARSIIGIKTNHQPAGIRPGLTGKITDIADMQPGFFQHFARHTLFQCFTRLNKTGNKTVKRTFEIVGMHQKNLIIASHQYDNRCCQLRPYVLAACRSPLTDYRMRFHRSTTDSTEFGIAVPIENLGSLAGFQINFFIEQGV